MLEKICTMPTIFNYDDNGRITRIETNNGDDKGTFVFGTNDKCVEYRINDIIFTYDYDDDGRLTHEIKKCSDEVIYSRYYFYIDKYIMVTCLNDDGSTMYGVYYNDGRAVNVFYTSTPDSKIPYDRIYQYEYSNDDETTYRYYGCKKYENSSIPCCIKINSDTPEKVIDINDIQDKHDQHNKYGKSLEMILLAESIFFRVFHNMTILLNKYGDTSNNRGQKLKDYIELMRHDNLKHVAFNNSPNHIPVMWFYNPPKSLYPAIEELCDIISKEINRILSEYPVSYKVTYPSLSGKCNIGYICIEITHVEE